jgi:hypothetical protein
VSSSEYASRITDTNNSKNPFRITCANVESSQGREVPKTVSSRDIALCVTAASVLLRASSKRSSASCAYQHEHGNREEDNWSTNFLIISLIRKYITKIRLLWRKIGMEAVFPAYIIKKNLRFKHILKTESVEELVVKSTLEFAAYPPPPTQVV